MAESYTLARPYADAVFELAEAAGDDGFAQWSDALAALSAIVTNETVAQLMSNPRVPDETLAGAIIATGDADFGDGARNLVRVLIDNNRLSLAPAIAELYEQRRAAAESRLDVRVTSAVALSEAQQKALSEALESRLSHHVSTTFERDESVIGGVVIRAGDLVIDGSLAAQLQRLRESVAG